MNLCEQTTGIVVPRTLVCMLIWLALFPGLPTIHHQKLDVTKACVCEANNLPFTLGLHTAHTLQELFYLLADAESSSEHEGGVVTTSSLAVELQAGGLTPVRMRA